MSKTLIDQWHQVVRSEDLDQLKKLIHKDCIFYSPIVFAPQKGKRLTIMYLSSAFKVFKAGDSFEYVREIEQGSQAVLEFNAVLDGIIVDGVDMIVWNDEGKIIEFKVMIRPFKAIEKIGEKMKEQLEQLTVAEKVKMKVGSILDKLK